MKVDEYTFPDELEAIDYLMLRSEADPRTRNPTLGIITLEGTPSLAKVRREYDRASRSFIRLRQHVVIPSLPITNPRWVVDPDFDINYHVRTVALSAPGSMRQLMDLARDVINDPFDLARPLWECVLVTGLGEDGKDSALLSKLHHSVVDGVGGMKMLKEFFDFEADTPERPMPPKPIPEDLSPAELTQKAMVSLTGRFLPTVGNLFQRGLSLGLEAAQHPSAAANDLQEQFESARRVLGELPCEPSPLMSRRGLGRWIDGFEFPFQDIRRAAKAAGCSINDAYLAAVCIALRRYHEELGEPVTAQPMAIPVNVRRDDDPSAGNRFAGARLVAPVGIEDPVDCMRAVRERVLSVTSEPAINLLGQIALVLNKLPQPMLQRFSELVASTDVQASNVPGYPGPMWFGSHRITGYYPIGPVPGVGIMLAMISMMGKCFIGVQLDTAAVTDQELFGRCLREAFEEVFRSADRAPEPADNNDKPAKRKSKASGKTKAASKSTTRKSKATSKTKASGKSKTAVKPKSRNPKAKVAARKKASTRRTGASS